MRNSHVAAALLALAPLGAHAATPPNYSYAEAGYTHLDADANEAGSLKLNGGYVRGAWAFSDSLQVFGSYALASESATAGAVSGEIDSDELTIGAGWQMSLSERVHFTTDLAYVRLTQKETIRGFSADSGLDVLNGSWDTTADAGRLTLGLIGKPSARTEAWIKAGVLDGQRMDGQFVGTLGGQFRFTPTWGVVSQIEWIGDHTRYTTGVRASF